MRKRRLGRPRASVQLRAARRTYRGQVTAELLDERVDRGGDRHRPGAPFSALRRAAARARMRQRYTFQADATAKKMTATSAAFATPPPVSQASEHDDHGERAVDEQRVAVRMLGGRGLGQFPLQTARPTHSSSPISASTAASSDPSRTESATASMSELSERSSRSRGESVRTCSYAACAPRPGSSGARNSIA